MEDKDIRSMLVDIVERGEFPDNSFGVLHVERIYEINPSGPNKVTFWITRHPHLLGALTRGMPSSAFIPIHYCYELDLKAKKVVLIEKEKDGPVINYWMLADEIVTRYMDGYKMPDEVIKIKSEADALAFAEKEFEEIPWLDEDECDDVPEGFSEELLEPIKSEFLDQFLSKWQVERDYLDED